VIAELLPVDVATAERSESVSEQALLAPELTLIEDAVPRRRAEFATARLCARDALSGLGIAPVPVLRGEKGEPLWPAGVVGSITHCARYHAAAVARSARFASIGIDAEPDEPLPKGVLEMICRPAERPQLSVLAIPNADRLLFSAKESLYKAWFPLARRWLGFDEASVVLHRDGRLEFNVLVAGPLATVCGRWLARDGLILTAAAVPTQPVKLSRDQQRT
jgi:4'-phosphopantetheinyl transferase EntD